MTTAHKDPLSVLDALEKEEEEEVDITTPCWFYLDANGLKQGPFSFKEMYLWWKSRYFPDDLLVKTIFDEHFITLGAVPQFLNASPKTIERIQKEQEEQTKKGYVEVPVVSAYYDEPIQKKETEVINDENRFIESSLIATQFNPISGTFDRDDGSAKLAARGLATDRNQRMMAQYFDYNAYQNQMRNAKEDENTEEKKKKKQKGTKKFWKERKEKKRRLKQVRELLED